MAAQTPGGMSAEWIRVEQEPVQLLRHGHAVAVAARLYRIFDASRARRQSAKPGPEPGPIRSPTIEVDGPPRMVKWPTGSGGEPSSPNCVASAGGKARQPSNRLSAVAVTARRLPWQRRHLRLRSTARARPWRPTWCRAPWPTPANCPARRRRSRQWRA